MTNHSDTTAKTNEASNGLGDLEGAVSNPPAWLSEALSVPREEGYVEVDGCNIHYFRWGDKSKPALLMMHGFLAHARCFAFIAPYLAKDYHIVAYDHSGMGDSGARESYSDEVRVNEVIGVARKTGLFDNDQKPTIIAHSFGGHVATNAVHAHPQSFAGVVICDLMILRPSYIEANQELLAPPAPKNIGAPNRVYPDYPTAKGRFRLSPAQKVGHPALFDYMAYHSLKQVDGGWSWKFSPTVFKGKSGAAERWMQVAEKVATAPVPKAIIYGEQSLLFNADSVDYMRELAEEHGQADFPIVGIPHAHHHLMLDQPIAFVSALRMVLGFWGESF